MTSARPHFVGADFSDPLAWVSDGLKLRPKFRACQADDSPFPADGCKVPRHQRFEFAWIMASFLVKSDEEDMVEKFVAQRCGRSRHMDDGVATDRIG